MICQALKPSAEILEPPYAACSAIWSIHAPPHSEHLRQAGRRLDRNSGAPNAYYCRPPEAPKPRNWPDCVAGDLSQSLPVYRTDSEFFADPPHGTGCGCPGEKCVTTALLGLSRRWASVPSLGPIQT